MTGLLLLVIVQLGLVVKSLESPLLDGPAGGGMGPDTAPTAAVIAASPRFGSRIGSRRAGCPGLIAAAGSTTARSMTRAGTTKWHDEIASTAIVPMIRTVEISICIICIVAMGAVEQYVVPAQHRVDHIQKAWLVGIAQIIVGRLDVVEVVHSATDGTLTA